MNDISGVGGTSGISQIAGTDGSNMSVEDIMAMLFLRRAETLSGLATDRAQQEQGKLDELNSAREMLARMTALKQDAGKHASEMPADMVAFCKEHNIDFDHTGNDNWHNKDEWGVNIQYLNTYIDKLSSNNDTFMIKLKSLVGKATNATEGANNVVTQRKQIMKDILTSFGR